MSLFLTISKIAETPEALDIKYEKDFGRNENDRIVGQKTGSTFYFWKSEKYSGFFQKFGIF